MRTTNISKNDNLLKHSQSEYSDTSVTDSHTVSSFTKNDIFTFMSGYAVSNAERNVLNIPQFTVDLTSSSRFLW